MVLSLRRSNQELQDFAHVAAHDLKVPLRGIGTLADWIASDYADQFDEQGRQQLGLLKRRVTRLTDLINGILHYSEIGRVTNRREIVDLGTLVPETIALLDPPAQIQVVVRAQLPAVVGEKVRLEQVFHNLIDNAIKYMDKPQGRIEIGCTDQGSVWQFGVTDNGPGIEERHFEKIFQMFQTLAPRDQCESTGIGLPIVKKIVELFGGRIWVESKPGVGTTFFFTLPKSAVVAETAALVTNECVSTEEEGRHVRSNRLHAAIAPAGERETARWKSDFRNASRCSKRRRTALSWICPGRSRVSTGSFSGSESSPRSAKAAPFSLTLPRAAKGGS